MALSDAKRCNARTKSSGRRCTNPAVKGRSVCRLHGGLGGRPPKHGLYSKELPVKLEQQRQQLIKDREDLLSLEPLIANLKIRLNRFEELKKAQEWDEKEIRLLIDTSESISKIIERFHKIELATQAGIPREQVKYFTNRLTSILTELLDTDTLYKVQREIQKAATETMPI